MQEKKKAIRIDRGREIEIRAEGMSVAGGERETGLGGLELF